MASRSNSRVSIFLLFCFPEVLFSAVVTLDSIEIYTTHQWIASTPKVYFQCSGEMKIVLPDVKKKGIVYNFRGEESFQISKAQNARDVGFMMRDLLNLMMCFDEWEFCPGDFKSDDGRYIRTKDKELNATFLCKECVNKGSKPKRPDNDRHFHETEDETHWSRIVIIGIIVMVLTVLLIMGLLIAYKFWQRRKRRQDQARFMKLFEETDDIEDELGIGPLSDSI